MVVMAMRHQRDIDRRQRVEYDAGIVDALGSGEAHWRDAFRPDRIDQDVEPSGLQQQRRMTHIRDAPLRPLYARWRAINVGARRPCGPFGLLSRAIPAQQRRKALRWRAMGIEEARAVEVIRHRSVIVTRRRGAQAEHAYNRAEGGEPGKQTAAGEQGHAKSLVKADEAHTFQRCGFYEVVIQSGERQSLALSKLKIH